MPLPLPSTQRMPISPLSLAYTRPFFLTTLAALSFMSLSPTITASNRVGEMLLRSAEASTPSAMRSQNAGLQAGTPHRTLSFTLQMVLDRHESDGLAGWLSPPAAGWPAGGSSSTAAGRAEGPEAA